MPPERRVETRDRADRDGGRAPLRENDRRHDDLPAPARRVRRRDAPPSAAAMPASESRRLGEELDPEVAACRRARRSRSRSARGRRSPSRSRSRRPRAAPRRRGRGRATMKALFAAARASIASDGRRRRPRPGARARGEREHGLDVVDVLGVTPDVERRDVALVVEVAARRLEADRRRGVEPGRQRHGIEDPDDRGGAARARPGPRRRPGRCRAGGRPSIPGRRRGTGPTRRRGKTPSATWRRPSLAATGRRRGRERLGARDEPER